MQSAFRQRTTALAIKTVPGALALASAVILAMISGNGCSEDKECAACPTPGITIVEIIAIPDTVTTGADVYLLADAQGADLQYRWTVSAGRIVETDDYAALWRTPDEPATVEVTVVAFNDKESASLVRTVLVRAYRPNHEPTYTGAGYCGLECHDARRHFDNYERWIATDHASHFVSGDGGFEGDCASCHTVGYGDVDNDQRPLFNGGYGYDELRVARLLGVQCENCHGPLSDLKGEILPDHDSLALGGFLLEVHSTGDRRGCGPCHENSPHELDQPYVSEWQSSAHARSVDDPAMQAEECAPCHSGQAFIIRMDPGALLGDESGAPLPIVCAACHDPHGGAEPGDLRVGYGGEPGDICRECHTDALGGHEEPHSPQAQMFAGTGGVEYPGVTFSSSPHVNVAQRGCVTCHLPSADSHSFSPDPASCTACHPDANGRNFEWSDAMSEIDGLIVALGDELARATPGDQTTDAYRHALFNYEFVTRDGSRGGHNFLYARDLLKASIDNFEPTGD